MFSCKKPMDVPMEESGHCVSLLCVIIRPLDVKGLLRAASVVGSLVFTGQVNSPTSSYLSEFSI